MGLSAAGIVGGRHVVTVGVADRRFPHERPTAPETYRVLVDESSCAA